MGTKKKRRGLPRPYRSGKLCVMVGVCLVVGLDGAHPSVLTLFGVVWLCLALLNTLCYYVSWLEQCQLWQPYMRCANALDIVHGVVLMLIWLPTPTIVRACSAY
jgi:hypothetical protein